MDPVTASSPPSTWRRRVRRRAAVRSSEGASGDAELEQRMEELEAAADRLRGEKEAAEAAEGALRSELDAERGAAETAASEAMLMIERLQREKAVAQMEARQFRRYAEGRADRDRELQDELADLSALAVSYLSRLEAHGIDPNTTDEDEADEQIDDAEVGAEANGESSGGSSNGMEVKGTVVEPESPVEKEFEYTIDVRCVAKAAAAVEVYADAADLYARVEALEADRAAMRREITALRMEMVQLMLTREVARRLCRAGVAERSIVRKEPPATRGFSAFAICKWVFSMIWWRKKAFTARFTFGLSMAILGLLLLLDRSAVLSCWRRLPRPRR